MSNFEHPIAVIGAGFSGTLTAVHLSRRLPGTPIILLEEGDEAGPGLAYQTSDPSAKLNVPAGHMSAFADRPDHFLDYAREILGDGVMPHDFLPRRIYGQYLKEILKEALEANPLLRVESRCVVDVIGPDTAGICRVAFKDHSAIEVSKVVLATGNQGSAFSGSLWAGHTESCRDPSVLDRVEAHENVLIIGTGLTMIDAVLHLNRRGHLGTIHAISRNGLLPRPCLPSRVSGLPDLDHLPDSHLRKSLRLFRNAIRDHVEKGGNWRELFHAIRPATPSLWQELSPRDRARFLRFLSPFWEVHRHQCAPEAHERIQRLIDGGKLVLHRGTIVSVEQLEGGGRRMGLAAARKNAPVRQLEVDHILDATGPARDLETIGHPLIRNLLRRGFLKPDTHRLGAETSSDYRAVGRDGNTSSWLFVVGPMLRARFFEATAVDELRLHTAALAARIASDSPVDGDVLAG